jgi:hypothetical protein
MGGFEKPNGDSTDTTTAHAEEPPVQSYRPLVGHADDEISKEGNRDPAPSGVVAEDRNRAKIWEAWTAFSGAVGLILYLFGWVFVDRFYGEFGIDPEDVGVGFSWLVSRVAITTTLLIGASLYGAILIVVVAKRVQWLRNLFLLSPSEFQRRLVRIAIWILSIYLAVVFISYLTFPAARAFWLGLDKDDSPPQVFVIMVGSLLVLSASLAFIWINRTYRSESKLPGLRDNLLVGILLTILICVGGSYVSWKSANSFAGNIRKGHDISAELLIGLPAFGVERVEVHALDTTRFPAGLDKQCMFFFGEADGVLVLFDHHTQHVWRVPSEGVILQHAAQASEFVSAFDASPPKSTSCG